jgi:choline dehydrogenase
MSELRRILEQSPGAPSGLVELLPGPDVRTHAELTDYVRCGPRQFRHPSMACERSQLPANHLAGTCKLGDETDVTAVVDRRLKVLGVRALRVADAAVMPTLPSGNTHATCLMVGERAAAFMLEDRLQL